MALTLAWCGIPSRALGQTDAGTPPRDAKADADRLERCFRAVEAAGKTVPRDTFDFGAVVSSAGKDPAALLGWVRDHTSLAAYRGCLRGPLGVLMDRRGNSLDRATLLAELLRVAGSPSRLARAELPEAAAKQLFAADPTSPKVPVMRLPSPVGREAIDSVVNEYGRPYGLDPAELRRATENVVTRSERANEEIVQRTAEQSATLADMVWRGAPPAAGDSAAGNDDGAVLEAARDHWWVQVRNGDRWTDLDPAPFAQDTRPSPAETIDWAPMDGHLPLDARRCHEIEVRVVIEKWQGGHTSEQVVLRQGLRPSELIGQHIALRHSPRYWPGDFGASREADAAGKIKALAAAEREWLPLLVVGKNLFYEGTFTDGGVINPKSDLDAFKKTGKHVGGAAAEAASLLDDKPAQPEAAPGQLTAEWIEYEIRVPGQPPLPVRREVFDLLGPAARAAGGGPTVDGGARLRRGLALLGETEILPLVCQPSEAFVEDLAVRNASALGKSLVGLLRSPTGVTPQQAAQASDVPPLPSRLYSLALVRYSASPHKDNVYFDRPNVFTLHQVLRADDGPSAGPSGLRFGVAIDIVANYLAIRPGVAPDEARRTRLAQGVLDTAAETVLLDDGLRAGAVSDALAARPDPAQWLVVRDAAAGQWKQAQVPPDVRARVEADLAAGYAVVVPLGAGDPVQNRAGGIGWWRVDPKTGSALGMSREGWGAAMAERAGLMLIVWGACWAGSAAVGKVGAGHDGRQAIACAFVAVGFAVLAPLEATKAALFVGAVAAGGGGSIGL